MHVVFLVWLLLHSLALLATFHAFLKSSTAQGAIAWALGLNTFPWLVLPVYLVFGSTHFEGYVEVLRQGSRGRQLAPLEGLSRLRYLPPPEQAATLQALERLAPAPFSAHNQIDLLIDGEAGYQRMFKEIDQAREYILVLFYRVLNDAVGRSLRDRLIAKARAGVRVYFVYDELGSPGIGAEIVRPLREAGVWAWPFRTARGWRHSLQLNFRNHRKIVLIDGKVALVGGLNVGERYLGTSEHFGPWRDTHVALRGPAVLGVQVVFCEDYHWATGGQLPEVAWEPQSIAEGAGLACTYLSCGPADRLKGGLLFMLAHIHAARRRLWLASPYFLPDPSVLDALKLADLRGVDVRILIPPGRFEPSMRLATLSFLPDLQTTGIKLYEYPGYNHSKVMLVDDWLSWVGSSNLDNRSQRLNFEGNLVVVGEDFASRIEEMLGQDFESSRRLDFAELARMSFRQHLAVRSARLFLPFL